MKDRWSKWLGFWLILLLFTSACNQVKKIVTRSSPREAFSEALENSPLNEKYFVRSWQKAWHQAKANPLDITLPYQEKGLFFPDDPEASALQFSARKGETVVIEIFSTVNVFAELYAKDELDEQPMIYFGENEYALSVEIESTGSYILVLQSELLASGRYSLTVRSDASVGFPVSGRNSRSIGSFWGAARDGGKRQHEGVDIFAPKGTPVLAVADGTVRAANNRLGGKVVWHRSDKGQNFYYAHLDSQVVGLQRVKMGDTIGFVGNTGNARYTPPHLHFGIYYRGRGAVDPFPFIDNVRPVVPLVKVDTTWNNRLARIASKAANLRTMPSTRSAPDTVLQQNTVVAIKSATMEWYRVSLPDGKNGFLHASVIDTLQSIPLPLPDSSLLATVNPLFGGQPIDSLDIDTPPDVYGTYGNQQLIRLPTGKFLWMKF